MYQLNARPWQFLYFFPLPQGHMSLRPMLLPLVFLAELSANDFITSLIVLLVSLEPHFPQNLAFEGFPVNLQLGQIILFTLLCMNFSLLHKPYSNQIRLMKICCHTPNRMQIYELF